MLVQKGRPRVRSPIGRAIGECTKVGLRSRTGDVTKLFGISCPRKVFAFQGPVVFPPPFPFWINAILRSLMDTLRYNLLVPIGMARRRLTSMEAKSFPCPSTPWRMVTGLPSSPLVASSLVGACPHGRHTSKPGLLHIRHHPSFALGCLLRVQFDVHPVRCFEHRGFVLLRKGGRKKVVILYPKPMPQKRPHFTTQSVGTHSVLL